MIYLGITIIHSNSTSITIYLFTVTSTCRFGAGKYLVDVL